MKTKPVEWHKERKKGAHLQQDKQEISRHKHGERNADLEKPSLYICVRSLINLQHKEWSSEVMPTVPDILRLNVHLTTSAATRGASESYILHTCWWEVSPLCVKLLIVVPPAWTAVTSAYQVSFWPPQAEMKLYFPFTAHSLIRNN